MSMCAIAWHHSIDRALPCWEDYQEALNRLIIEQGDGSELPTTAALQSLITARVSNLQGNAVQFVSPSLLPATNYEEQIFTTGRVSTRTNNWHDLFNALVWWRFPALKAAMNAMHFEEINTQSGTGRGKLRDALTLWDECGVIVASTNEQVLKNLAHRNWNAAFRESAHLWQHDTRLFICGHALLEKFLSPYKAITAHALLVQLDPGAFALDRAKLLTDLDKRLSCKLRQGELIKTTAALSPIPLAGIPGWWRGCEQDEDFYADDHVFRKPVVSINPAPVVKLKL